MSIELAVPQADRLADDLVAILALGEDRPVSPAGRRRRFGSPVLLAGLVIVGSAIAIFSVARLPWSSQPGVATADRRGPSGRDGATARPAARTVAARVPAVVAPRAPLAERRYADADAKAPPAPPAPARRNDAAPAAAPPPAAKERSRATALASRPPLQPRAGGPATIAPPPARSAAVVAERPPPPAAAPAEQRVARAEAPDGGEQSAAAVLPPPAPLPPADAEAPRGRGKDPAEQHKVREGLDALRLLRRQ